MTETTSNDALGPSFRPDAVEKGLYDWWDASGYFQPNDRTDRDPFVVIMPPPNVTGELHIGHALFVGIQDIMIRYHRMLGDPALWLPGADHAGIAGQWVVEKLLAQEGLTRHDIGREAFVERVWEYMDRYRGRIRDQMRILGASTDWTRFAFTMDPGPSRAVRHMFKRLHDKGLIYRGERLISWCPRCMTALSDLEVVHKDVQSHLRHLAYPLDGDPDTRIIVATTRPETMLGDTAVAVHPDDERYQHLIGKQLRLPISNRLVPIVGDDSVDKEFGSGAVKVTPAHDHNDFEIGKRHNLPFVTLFNNDGTLNREAGDFEGLSIKEARPAVVARLEELGALIDTVPHAHAVGHCERCGTVVEPLISKQWFIDMAPLAAPAIDVAKTGQVQFVPDRFKGVYLNWMENIHDWCISRQLWWGHRIPVWYCDDCGEFTVTTEETIERCESCGSTAIRQDPDVLDTWFSSGLWTFSTLGWPDETPDLKRFYPGAVMETGYEILFFWVARMIFFGLDVMGEPPFHTVYLHGTVRDAEGAKMSKTKGNVLDPTEITSEYGADALRFALVTQGSPGVDMRLSMQQVESSRNFVNKLWNATRFALRSISAHAIEMDGEGPFRPSKDLGLADRWILSRLESVTADVTQLLDSQLYGEAGRQLREFVWSELCDWYIEASKVRARGTAAEQAAVAQTLAYVLERSVRLLHPYLPFATESLWQALPHVGESVMVAKWPQAGVRDEAAEDDFNVMIELVRSIRNARAESNVEPGRWIEAQIIAGKRQTAFEEARLELGMLARIADDKLTIVANGTPDAHQAVTVVAADVVASLPLAGLVDLSAERDRLQKELEQARQEQQRAAASLSNEAFVAKAPEKVIEQQRTRLRVAEEQIEVLSRRIAELG
jgi:valyl-tRNA synthetase